MAIQIYAWTDSDRRAFGKYKIGDTKHEDVKDRIAQVKTAASGNMIVIYSETIGKIGTSKGIKRDKDLHEIMLDDSDVIHVDTKSKRDDDDVAGGVEWFDFSYIRSGDQSEEAMKLRDQEVVRILNSILLDSKKLNKYDLLEPQDECVKFTSKGFKKNNIMLMNAIMRFGKTFATYKIIEKNEN